MSQSLPDALPAIETPTPAEILVGILSEIGDLPQLMEFYYLWREPHLLDVLRLLSSAPPRDLERLAQLFRDAAQDSALRVEFPDARSAILRLN